MSFPRSFLIAAAFVTALPLAACCNDVGVCDDSTRIDLAPMLQGGYEIEIVGVVAGSCNLLNEDKDELEGEGRFQCSGSFAEFTGVVAKRERVVVRSIATDRVYSDDVVEFEVTSEDGGNDSCGGCEHASAAIRLEGT